jgi:hypothetical protein
VVVDVETAALLPARLPALGLRLELERLEQSAARIRAAA